MVQFIKDKNVRLDMIAHDPQFQQAHKMSPLGVQFYKLKKIEEETGMTPELREKYGGLYREIDKDLVRRTTPASDP